MNPIHKDAIEAAIKFHTAEVERKDTKKALEKAEILNHVYEFHVSMSVLLLASNLQEKNLCTT